MRSGEATGSAGWWSPEVLARAFGGCLKNVSHFLHRELVF